MDTQKESQKKPIFSYLLSKNEAMLVELFRQQNSEMIESLDKVFRLCTFGQQDTFSEDKQALEDVYNLKEIFSGKGEFLNSYMDLKLPKTSEDDGRP